MSNGGPQRPENHRGLAEPVRRRRAREEQFRREGEPPMGRQLAWIGMLGWLVVAPALAGMFLGRWIDARFASGIFWTASLLFLGICLGSWLAWRRMHEP
jgi:ATP synthase protein I